MITQTRYFCEHCLTEYASEENCLKCEASHVAPDTIESAIYKRDRIYPISVSLTMDDGAIVQYAFDKVLEWPKENDEVSDI